MGMGEDNTERCKSSGDSLVMNPLYPRNPNVLLEERTSYDVTPKSKLRVQHHSGGGTSDTPILLNTQTYRRFPVLSLE